jgi:hypothetical protein
MRTLKPVIFLAFLVGCAAPHVVVDKPLTRADIEYESVYAVADAWEVAFGEVLPVKYFTVLVQYKDGAGKDGRCAEYWDTAHRIDIYSVVDANCLLDSMLVHELVHAAVHTSMLSPSPDAGPKMLYNSDDDHRTAAVWGATGRFVCAKPSQCAGSVVGEALRVVRGLQ